MLNPLSPLALSHRRKPLEDPPPGFGNAYVNPLGTCLDIVTGGGAAGGGGGVGRRVSAKTPAGPGAVWPGPGAGAGVTGPGAWGGTPSTGEVGGCTSLMHFLTLS